MRPLIPTLMLLASAPASEQLPASSTDTLAAGDHSTRPEVARTCDLVVTFTEEVGKSAAQPAPSSNPGTSATLAAPVEAQAWSGKLSRELHCLASAIYFEARSEALAGQLAVGRVIIARTRSGRFPASYCGVVFQPSQFSFVHGNTMPPIDTGSLDWREAVAVARIAVSDTLQTAAEGALYFHKAQISPNWNLERVTRIQNHIFYR